MLFFEKNRNDVRRPLFEVNVTIEAIKQIEKLQGRKVRCLWDEFALGLIADDQKQDPRLIIAHAP